MSIFDKILARNRDRPDNIPTGRRTEAAGLGFGKRTLSPLVSRTADILDTLREIEESHTAIDYLKRVNSDVSMAIWNFVRLSNLGNSIEFYSTTGKKEKIVSLESEWREFAARVNQMSNSGLDGVIDQLHNSAYMHGAMGLEAEVSADRLEIVDIYPVKPTTITWEYEERDGRKVWIPYQQQFMKRIPLEPGKANFFWVPTDPDIDDPRGTLILEPVLQSVDFQMQILQDLQAVLHHQGWPRNDIAISMEQIAAYCPASIKNDPKKFQAYLKKQWDWIKTIFKSIEPEDDYLHFDDVTINMNQGANAARSLDVRAVNELVDVSVLSALKQLAIFMNRNQGVTESWGTVQFRIFCSGIQSIQRGSKRLVEDVARLWLRVNGVQATPKFEHNLIDWSSEEQRMQVSLLKQQYYAIAQLMGWIDEDMAASNVMGVEKAVGKPPAEGVRVSFSSDGKFKDKPKGNNAKRKEDDDQWQNDS